MTVTKRRSIRHTMGYAKRLAELAAARERARVECRDAEQAFNEAIAKLPEFMLMKDAQARYQGAKLDYNQFVYR